MAIKPATLARLADMLTTARFGLAVVAGVAFATGSLDIGAAIVALAWWSDMADGRLARRAGGGTRFGHLDLPADVSMAVGILVGLFIAGRLPTGLAVACVVLFALAVGTRTPAPALLFMGMVNALMLWLVHTEGGWSTWPVLLTPVAALMLDGRRLFRVVIPAFVRSAWALLSGKSLEGSTLEDFLD